VQGGCCENLHAVVRRGRDALSGAYGTGRCRCFRGRSGRYVRGHRGGAARAARACGRSRTGGGRKDSHPGRGAVQFHQYGHRARPLSRRATRASPFRRCAAIPRRTSSD